MSQETRPEDDDGDDDDDQDGDHDDDDDYYCDKVDDNYQYGSNRDLDVVDD